MSPDTMSPEPTYIILATERVAVGMLLRPGRAEDITARYSPTAILPDEWRARPVARLQRPSP